MEWNRSNLGMLAAKARTAGQIEEPSIADVLGAENALPVVDASVAMRAVLFGLGFGPACEVLVPAFGKNTPGPDVASVGARPSYVDVGPDIVLNRGNLTRKIESEYRRENGQWVHKRRGWTLRGIVMTHPFGFSPFVDEVEEFAAEHGLILVDDARCALGSRVWSTSRSAWISPGTCGSAGVISSRDCSFVVSGNPDLLRIVSMHAKSAEGNFLDTESIKELRISGMRARKSLSETLGRARVGEIPETPNYCQPACPEVLLVAGDDRDEVAERLEETGFSVETDFWPQKVMSACDRQFGYRRGRCPDSEDLARRAIAVSVK